MKHILILGGILLFATVFILGCIGSTSSEEHNKQPGYPLTECTSDSDCIASIRSPTCCINKDKVGEVSSTYLDDFCYAKTNMTNINCECSSGTCANKVSQEQPPINGSATPMP